MQGVIRGGLTHSERFWVINTTVITDHIRIDNVVVEKLTPRWLFSDTRRSAILVNSLQNRNRWNQDHVTYVFEINYLQLPKIRNSGCGLNGFRNARELEIKNEAF